MEIVMTRTGTVINPELKRGGFIRAKYQAWNDWRNGLVAYVGRTVIKVLFMTNVQQSTSYFTIRASEVAAGLWAIEYAEELNGAANQATLNE